ncbi:low-density lipoprotein receptor-related protein 8-like [Aulostomus maculatus]
MGHLGGLFILITAISQCFVLGAAGHLLPSCREQLDFRCNDGWCIQRQRVCDQHVDCGDGSDERNCSHLGCQKEEFTCLSSRRCIASHFLCDAVDDCGDGSDEESCHNCTDGFFSCGRSDACLPQHMVCDGQADCVDGRDETLESCGLASPRLQTSSTCPLSEFHCGDGQCIRQSWKCDGSPDCSDGSDEYDCDLNECLVSNGGCSHECVDLPMGFLCKCPENMRLLGESQCEDVDVCLDKDVCDQLCIHTKNSLACDCHEGYHMTPDNRGCTANGVEAQLVFTSSKDIGKLSLLGRSYMEVAAHLPRPRLVAALVSNSTLYVAQQGPGSILGISLSEKSQRAMSVLKVQGSVSGLALDWIHQLLYWTSTENGSVNVGLLDGSAQRVLITGLEEPCAVAVDPLHGFLFWSECGSSPKIVRASLDGRGRKVLVSSLIHQPVALSLDMPRQLLYWVDRRQRSISRVTLEGRHRKVVVESNGYLDGPLGLAVFEGFVYWSDEVTNSICRANKHNGSQFQVLLNNVTSPGGVAIIQPALQPNREAVCGRIGMACKHGCVINLISETPRFICPSLETTKPKPQVIPAVSHTVPASDLSHAAFAGILSLIMFLSLLLVGMAVLWWRDEFRPSRTLPVQSFSLKESQDPLIQGADTCVVKDV